MSFSALYLDVNYLDDSALDTILGLALEGLPVCLKKMPRQPGERKSPTFEERLRRLDALPNVSSDFTRVAREQPLVAGDKLPDFWARVDGTETLIFFANPKTRGLRYPLEAAQSLANEDIEYPVKISVGGKTTSLTLVFEPYQSILVAVDAGGAVRPVDISFRPATPRAAGAP